MHRVILIYETFEVTKYTKHTITLKILKSWFRLTMGLHTFNNIDLKSYEDQPLFVLDRRMTQWRWGWGATMSHVLANVVVYETSHFEFNGIWPAHKPRVKFKIEKLRSYYIWTLNTLSIFSSISTCLFSMMLQPQNFDLNGWLFQPHL